MASPPPLAVHPPQMRLWLPVMVPPFPPAARPPQPAACVQLLLRRALLCWGLRNPPQPAACLLRQRALLRSCC